jgi:hypothetical protein
MKANKVMSVLLLFVYFSTNLTAKGIPLSSEELVSLEKNVTVLRRPSINVMDGVDNGSYYFLQLSVKDRKGLRVVNAFLNKADGAIYR